MNLTLRNCSVISEIPGLKGEIRTRIPGMYGAIGLQYITARK